MKRLFFYTILCYLIPFRVFALADLTLSQGSIDNNRLNRGEYLTVRATAINQGDRVATATYGEIYLRQVGTTSNILLGRIGLKALSIQESQVITYVFPMPRTLAIGNYNVVVNLDSENELQENNESNLFCMGTGTCTVLTITNQYSPDRNLPCPIIFVHGWVGDNTTWSEFSDNLEDYYGLTNGGVFHYCLNPDGNNYTGDRCENLLDFTNYNYITRSADFYTVNFNIGRNGRAYYGDDLSNQAAVTKQGCALSKIIKQVLSLTNAKEVILVGHSMGGLASREYIQNQGQWQSDGQHHIAKLLTVGTPNGGSNTSGLGLGIFGGYDELSEAVRDLRHPSTRFNGIYLFGGNEASVVASYNNDINCNGRENDAIVGLNSKPFRDDIAAACIIGSGVGFSLCTGSSDLVVCDDRADLNIYPFSSNTSLHADKFIIQSDGSFIPSNNIAYHGNLHKKNPAIMMQGLDEPKTYSKAYDINVGEGFFGHITTQAANDPFPEPDKSTDYDDYRFKIEQRSAVRVLVTNIPTRIFSAFIVDSNYQVIRQFSSNGGSNIDQNIVLEKGTYYFEISARPDSKSWFSPYFFGLLSTPLGGVPNAIFTASARTGCAPTSVSFVNQSTGSPTTYSWKFEGGNPATSISQNPTVNYLSAGNYSVTLTVSNTNGSTSSIQQGYISVGKISQANFSNTSDSLTVKFFNLTDAGIEANYMWDFGDGTSSTVINPTRIYARAGNYTVKLTAANACGTHVISKNIVVRQTTPSAELAVLDDSDVFLSPNPTNGKVFIKTNFSYDQIRIFNSLGQLMTDKKTTDIEIDLSYLPTGIYHLEFSQGNKKVNKRLMKN